MVPGAHDEYLLTEQATSLNPTVTCHKYPLLLCFRNLEPDDLSLNLYTT